MAPTKVTDHQARARDDLLQQFKGLPNIQAIVDAASAQVQDLEEALWELLINRWLPTAEGVQLDTIGRIIDRGRGTLADDVYRGVLRGKIAANLSSGTYPEVLRVVELCVDFDTTAIAITVTPEHPAAAVLSILADSLTADLGPHVADLITLAAANGVRLLFQYYETDPPFAFDGAGSAKFDGGYHFTTTIEGS